MYAGKQSCIHVYSSVVVCTCIIYATGNWVIELGFTGWINNCKFASNNCVYQKLSSRDQSNCQLLVKDNWKLVWVGKKEFFLQQKSLSESSTFKLVVWHRI